MKKGPRGLTPDEMAKVIKRLGDAYRALADERGWAFVDLFPVLKAPDDFVDAAHATDAGNRKIAEAMRRAIDALVPVTDAKK